MAQALGALATGARDGVWAAATAALRDVDARGRSGGGGDAGPRGEAEAEARRSREASIDAIVAAAETLPAEVLEVKHDDRTPKELAKEIYESLTRELRASKAAARVSKVGLR